MVNFTIFSSILNTNTVLVKENHYIYFKNYSNLNVKIKKIVPLSLKNILVDTLHL